MKITKALAALAVLTIGAQPVLAATTLGPKDSARVSRASPRDRDEVRYCLIQKKKGTNKRCDQVLARNR